MRDDETRDATSELPQATKQGLLPDLNAGMPTEVWKRYFAEERTPATVARVVRKLIDQEAHPHVIAAIQQALLAGHSQPWMYEVLAFSMKIEEYPQQQIDRVLLSNVDFQASDVPNLLVSAAYLHRLDSNEAALKLYRQAAQLLPTQVEAYLLGLNLAIEMNDQEGIVWAANGVLVNAMDPKYRPRRIKAEAALREVIEQTREGDPEQSQKYEALLQAALQQDLRIRLSWTGGGDIDLTVREPGGAICSLHDPQTVNGGQFLHDGFGPDPKNCFEEYVAVQATPGVYQLRVQYIQGEVVGNRYRLTIIRNAGGPDETRQEFSLSIQAEMQTIQIKLPSGRRTALLDARHLNAPGARTALTSTEAKQLKREQLSELPVAGNNRPLRANPLRQQANVGPFGGPGVGGGAVGYAPVVTTLSEGVSLSVLPVVSADRRYVRISTRPVFSNITDVFTFGIVQQNP
ncbi:MAG: hypothetical protein CMJ46_05065 [Planctomyces sp.]|nr:hypothetical protein [Planctomyces sp.]